MAFPFRWWRQAEVRKDRTYRKTHQLQCIIALNAMLSTVMARPDLNLLQTLDVLLAEGSVAGAARRLKLSASAMSRALARLRAATGDPLLVRAGRGLVPTPRALALREQVHDLVLAAEGVLRPEQEIDLSSLKKVFSLRTSDGFVESFGARLLARVTAEAPGVQLNFVQKTEKESAALRDGRVDLETGVVDMALGPELRSLALFQDRLIGVVRQGHPLAGSNITLKDFRSGQHVVVSRSGTEQAATDLPFADDITHRQVSALVSGFSAALALAKATDLIATVPDRHTQALRDGMHTFELPARSRPFVVSMLWHPRMDADPAHRWLRSCVKSVTARESQ